MIIALYMKINRPMSQRLYFRYGWTNGLTLIVAKDTIKNLNTFILRAEACSIIAPGNMHYHHVTRDTGLIRTLLIQEQGGLIT